MATTYTHTLQISPMLCGSWSSQPADFHSPHSSKTSCQAFINTPCHPLESPHTFLAQFCSASANSMDICFSTCFLSSVAHDVRQTDSIQQLSSIFQTPCIHRPQFPRLRPQHFLLCAAHSCRRDDLYPTRETNPKRIRTRQLVSFNHNYDVITSMILRPPATPAENTLHTF
jgi:hypothetical protein